MRKCRYSSALAVGLIGLASAVAACHPGEFTDVERLDVVVTLHDEAVDFSSFSSLAIIDSVIQLRDPGDRSDTVTISRVFDDLMISTVISGYTDLGYDVVLVSPGDSVFDPSARPDFVVFISVSATENWAAYLTRPFWGYWGWWPGWGWWPSYGPGWVWWYPCCPGIDAASYPAGTVFVDMIDPNAPDNDGERLPAVWTAALNGVIGGTLAGTAARLERGIEQAFAQSPYLRVD